MTKGYRYISSTVSAALFVLCISACSTTKTVPDNDRLYTGADVKWEGRKPRDYSTLSAEMSSQTRPKPNRKFAGMPFRLWLYNLGKEPKGKGLNHLLRNKWGEPPVLLSSAKPDYTANVLEQYLVDNGFFQATVTSEIKNSGKKKASINYNVTPNTRYRIKSVTYETDSSDLGKAVAAAKEGSSLKLRRPYRLDSVVAERNRVHNILKEQGYYYFTPDHLLVEVDSTNGGMVDLYLKVKDETPAAARHPYRMKNITLYPNYSLDNDSASRRGKPVQYNHIRIVDSTEKFRPSVFDRSVFLKPDSLYRLSNHNITLRRLTDMGTFKFVKGQFRTVRGDSSRLNASFFLTPYPRRSLSAELRGTSKSNNFVGSEIRITSKNRNWLHAANLLEIILSGGMEWQVGGRKTANNTTLIGGNSYNVKAEAAVTIPRFWQPLFNFNVRTPYVPRTRISLSYELFSRSQLYNLNAYSFQFQYIWRQTQYLEHRWSPIAITYVLPTSTTPGYDSILFNDPSQRAAIEKQFILGGNYSVTYNNQSDNRIHSFYLNGDLDYSGNLAGLVVPKKDSGRTIIGAPFAQYVRLTADLRHYWKLNRKLTWVNRLYAGFGIPYGNSTTLPFVKQYFIGGSSSLRGFRARTLGPGSYKDTASQYLANEAGDIRLEFNSELRAKLTGIFNAAVFVDAGNIWLKQNVPTKPGSKFSASSFGNQIAVDAGVGLRVDASIIVVRLDLAFPLRKPWLPSDERWVVKDIKFGDPDWRKENLILNIAIGYPF
ncbi:translocation and assembly module lipoprotein TamL [Chitinophaga rhizophila]|uniref:Outer membrane protein assembly factor n=1 Tax=Chitinophaga rhizophila TaxID=2866212 RepID=A0ABS7GEK3_9BACT|nr:BamA/TamA family outer membrane protein [Chitinophaga rhizophila]MBW8686103.1 outer membrane protein assembly factor [Chitinophaga rhizophila]